MIYHAGSHCPAAEADIAGLAGSVPRDGETNDEEDSEFESSSQRPHFASVEQDQETKHRGRNYRVGQS